MLLRNKHLKKINALYNNTNPNKKFFKKHGFEPCETYSLDYSTLCFFYTRFKVFVKRYEKVVKDEHNLVPRIKKIIKRLKKLIKKYDTLEEDTMKEYNDLMNDIVMILPECWW